MKKYTIALLALLTSQAFAVNVYNWSDYEDMSVTKAYPNMVHKTYTDNAQAVAAIKNGQKFDVVTPSGYTINELVKANKLQKINPAMINNYSNINKSILSLVSDKKDYFVPYTIGGTLIAYDVNKIKASLGGIPANEWDILKPENIKKINCGVDIANNPVDIMATFGHIYGVKLNALNPQSIQTIGEKMATIKGNVNVFDNEVLKKRVSTNKSCVAVNFNGDLVQVAKGSWKVATPVSGAALWVDGMVIPASGNASEAHKYINYVLDINKNMKHSLASGYQTTATPKPADSNNASFFTPEFLNKSQVIGGIDNATMSEITKQFTLFKRK